ncbi:hypothetical protein AB0E00_33090, partial [Streptomyces sp. NPDC048110]
RIRRSAVVVVAAAVLPLSLAACSDDGDSGSSARLPGRGTRAYGRSTHGPASSPTPYAGPRRARDHRFRHARGPPVRARGPTR